SVSSYDAPHRKRFPGCQNIAIIEIVSPDYSSVASSKQIVFLRRGPKIGLSGLYNTKHDNGFAPISHLTFALLDCAAGGSDQVVEQPGGVQPRNLMKKFVSYVSFNENDIFFN
ncbi:hypothetical protein BaRGS_00004472, partial [Batillaria attramentaria]